MAEKLEYEITDIDYWENDALLKVGDKSYYFQFDESPTIFEALEFFKRDSKFYKDEQANDEVPCKDHPDAPHGFLRDASHSVGRYVCECEYWEPENE